MIRFISPLLINSWLVVSDFRPSYARYVFPCFDEPRFKAKFRIIVEHWESYTGLSNMPAEVSHSYRLIKLETIRLPSSSGVTIIVCLGLAQKMKQESIHNRKNYVLDSISRIITPNHIEWLLAIYITSLLSFSGRDSSGIPLEIHSEQSSKIHRKLAVTKSLSQSPTSVLRTKP